MFNQNSNNWSHKTTRNFRQSKRLSFVNETLALIVFSENTCCDFINKCSPAIIPQQRSLLHCKKSALLYFVPSLFFGSTYDTTPVAGCQWSTQALCPFRCLVEIGSSTHGPQIPLLLSPNRPVFLISALLFAFIGFHSRITEHRIIGGGYVHNAQTDGCTSQLIMKEPHYKQRCTVVLQEKFNYNYGETEHQQHSKSLSRVHC